MKYLTNKLIYGCFRLAQHLAPFKTGNLRHNAMYLIMHTNGFTIVYDDMFAYYIDALEYAYNSARHKYFIRNRTFNALVAYLRSILVGPSSKYYIKGMETDEYSQSIEDSIYHDYINSSPEARAFQKQNSVSRYEVNFT